MKPSTIHTLNQLNKDFYQKVASSFNQTRQYSWQGWAQLLPYLKAIKQPISVLDIGCGNARFAKFLKENQLEFSYHGVDSSRELLSAADEQLKKLDINFKLTQADLVELLTSSKLSSFFKEKYDFIVAFGVLHHIPSLKLRKEFIFQLGKLLASTQAKLVVTAWQFAADERFRDKFINPDLVGINSEDLQKNDFILGWKKQDNAFRYCHFVDKSEVRQLNVNKKELMLHDQFLADGKSNQLNRYLIFSKK